MGLFSISIDITGSTAIKQKIVDISKGDSKNIHRLYEQFSNLLFGVEKGFYQKLKQHDINLEYLFLLKGIGDELWYFYDLEEIPVRTIEFNDIFNSFLETCSEIIRSSTILISDREIEFDESMADPEGEFETVTVPLKIFIDYIEDCYEISGKKLDYFGDTLHQLYTATGEKIVRDDEKYIKLIHNLGMGIVTDTTGGKISIAHRTDFIGLEIDKFFRVSKYALPGIFSCGEALLNSIILQESKLSDVTESDITKFQMMYGTTDHRQFRNYLVYKRIIDKNDLKGLGDDYVVYYLFLDFMIDGWILLAPDYLEDQYAITRESLRSVGYKRIIE